MSVDVERVRRLLGVPELEWFVARVAERIASGAAATEGTVSLADPDAAQRRAVERLLGRPPGRGRTLTVRLADVDTMLRESEACLEGLAAAVVTLRGPIAVRREIEARLRTSWDDALTPLVELAGQRPDLAPWVEQHVRAAGLLKRLREEPEAGRVLAERAARVLAVLPHAGIVRGVLAARTIGDAHGLDEGRPLSALVFSAVRVLAGMSVEETGSAEGRRRAWAGVGVAQDVLSSRVLVLNVPPDGEDRVLSRLLAAAGAGGEPVVLTLRMLEGLAATGPDLAGVTVSVCENPAVVAAAAAELGAACPPLVCLEGVPSVAANRLLRRLLDRGASLRYHGDFDRGGLRIAASVFDLGERAGGVVMPWRFDSAAYLEAVTRGLGAPFPAGAVAATPWDPALRQCMETHCVRVEEEQVVDLLLADLAEVGRENRPALPPHHSTQLVTPNPSSVL